MEREDEDGNPSFPRLRSSLRGSLVLPDDETYDDARAVWNAAIDRRPAAIARCADARDAQRALEVARAQNLPIAVRGGGHSFAGKAVCDDGLVSTRTPMKQVEIDRERRVARAGTGCTLGDFDAATQAMGLATTLGTAPPTGISGLTLGGGIGWLMGVTGSLATTSSAPAWSRPMVASYAQARRKIRSPLGLARGRRKFRGRDRARVPTPSRDDRSRWAIIYPVECAADVLRAYRDVTDTAPDELVAMSGMLPLATGPAFGVAVCWNGDAAAGERVIAPLRRLGKPLTDTVRPVPYLEIQSLLSPPPIRVASYARSSFLAELSDGAIDVLAARAASPSPVMGVFFMEHLHGRASAFGAGRLGVPVHRTPGHNFAALSMWLEPGDAEAATAHVRNFFSDLSPFLAQGVYANYLGGRRGARDAQRTEQPGAGWSSSSENTTRRTSSGSIRTSIRQPDAVGRPDES